MKKTGHFVLLVLLITAIDCQAQTIKHGAPIVRASYIIEDFGHYWTYYREEVKYPHGFVALDDSDVVIDKEVFFKKLISGNYIPVKLKSKDEHTYFRLYPLPAGKDDIKQTSSNMSIAAYNAFKMEQKPMPPFDFSDLDGKEYNNENTKGKIVVLKCWFIHCGACVAEMPELNKIVKKYQRQNDVIFVSLAIDSAGQLKDFLRTKEFCYATVANQQKFMKLDLRVNMYPTHFVINRDGTIYKIVNNADELKIALKELMN